MTFTAGWNIPGCLPDSIPEDFETLDDAKQYLIWSIKNIFEEEAETEEQAESFCAAAEDVNLWSGEDSLIVNHVAFWIHEI